MSTSGDIRKLVKAAKDSGWTVIDNSTGRHNNKLISPAGETLVFSWKPGSSKAVVAFRQRLRRRGVDV